MFFAPPASTQVHYHADGNPWKQRARRGPDAEVDGWYYNLGITGLRVQLQEDAPKHLLVKHVFADSLSARKVRPGDLLVGAGGKPFETEHRNGYGMDKFGPEGPILEFAQALEASQGKAGKGRLALTLLRDGEVEEVELKLGRKYGTYAQSYPEDCNKTKLILAELYEYLVDHPESFPDTHGSPIMGMGYAALAANAIGGSFRSLMDANGWWFTLAQCHDGSFYYQPNRDNAGYGADSRLSATAVTAFILSIPKGSLHLTGKPFRR